MGLEVDTAPKESRAKGVRVRSIGRARTTVRVQRSRWMALLFTAPALIAIAATVAYPLAYNVWLSLNRFNLTRLYEGQTFIGLANYIWALGSDQFYGALGNSILITAACLALELPLGFLLALALHHKVRARRLWQFVFLLPLLLVPAVVGFMWRFMFQYDGIVNYTLHFAGLSPVNWSSTQAGLLSVIIVVTWQNAPFSFVVLLAGLQSVDPDIEEAAQIDGASLMQRIRYVTLPMIRPFLLLVLTIRTMDLLRVFDEGYVLTRGGPGRSTETLSQLVYTNSFTFFDIGRGAALSLIQTAIIIGFIVFYFLVLHRGASDVGQ